MKYVVQVIACIFCFLDTSAQNMEATLATYARDYSEEKVYLHYDKSAYVPGETIWFKVYLMNEILPGNESKTIYVDWIGEDGDILSHSLWTVENASAFGQFEIPANYTGRFIHVKAYTKWMLNFNSVFLYNHDIRILSDKKGPQAKLIPELNFFPEGGDAIAGVANKIAFKANDQYGRPVAIRGVIKNDTGATIDSLNTQHDGMGYFFISPQPGQSFSAFWEDEHGNSHITELPAIKTTGVNLRVTVSGSKRLFFVSAAPSSSVKAVRVLGTMYQQKVFELDKELNDGALQAVIPTASLPSGILTITVFDEQWNPLAERITYIKNEEYLFQPEVNVVAKPGKRAKNSLQIEVPGNMAANLSVSVTDAKIESDNSDNIISHLLLTGELKGNVFDPVHYFFNNSDSVANQLDLVMLTNGWRRFDWERVVKGEFPEIKYRKDTSYLSLSGKITGATPRQLKKAGYIILSVTQDNSGPQSFSIPIEPNGYFNDPSLILFGTADISYDFTNKNTLPKASVQVMPDFVPAFSNYFDPPSFAGNYFLDSSANQYQLNVSPRGGPVEGSGSGSAGGVVTFAQIGNVGGTTSNINGLDNNRLSGYNVLREFYSPDYDTLPADEKKDLRTTLYWNPTVITTPGKNKVDLTFFNNDFTGEFRVVIEGMTADGRLTHIEKIIK